MTRTGQMPLLRDCQPSLEVGERLRSSGPNPYLNRLSSFDLKSLKKPKHSLIGLFCGGGGLDLGLGFAGFGTIVASDVSPVFVETVTSNLPNANGLVGDAMELSASALVSLAGTDDIDLVAAGPPCQSFSILGRRGALADPRGKLALKFFELVSDLQPRAFLFENVQGLLTVNRGEDWRQLYGHAQESTHYHLHYAVLNSVTFGVPQYRERVILIGFREQMPFEFPKEPTGHRAREYLDGLVHQGYSECPAKWALENVEGLPNHLIRNHGERVAGRYAAIKPGDRDRIDHTDRIRPDCPSGTVLVGSSEGGGRPHIHPTEPRVITVREAARLQSFPDWYEFHGTVTAQYRQVGNAVPPLLAYEVGLRIVQALESD